MKSTSKLTIFVLTFLALDDKEAQEFLFGLDAQPPSPKSGETK